MGYADRLEIESTYNARVLETEMKSMHKGHTWESRMHDKPIIRFWNTREL